MNIKLKLNLILLFLTIVTAVVVGSISFVFNKKTIEEQTLKSLESILESRINHINNAMQLRLEQGKIISGTYLAKMLKPNAKNDPEHIAKLQQHIDFIRSEISKNNTFNNKQIAASIEHIGIWDANGKVIANTNKNLIGTSQPADLLDEIKKKEYYFKGYVRDQLTDDYYLMDYSVIRNHEDNSFAGVVVTKMNNETLKSILNDYTGLGQSGEIVLAQVQGNDLQLITPSRNHPEVHSIPLKSLNHQALRSALIKNNGKGRIKNLNNEESFAVWRYDLDKNWIYCAEISLEEALQPVSTLQRNSMIGLLIVIFAVFVLSHFASSRFTYPISKLVETFKELSNGHEVKSLAVSGKDEIAALSQAANDTINYVNRIIAHTKQLSKGDYSTSMNVEDKNDVLGLAIEKLTNNLRQYDEDNKNTIWLQKSISEVNNVIRGDMNSDELSDKVLNVLSRILHANVGVLYEFTEFDGMLSYRASYAVKKQSSLAEKIKPGDGLIGQSLKNKNILVTSQSPSEFLKVSSAIGEADPLCIVCLPLLFKDRPKGVIELGLFHTLNKTQLNFLESVSEIIAIALTTAENRKRIQDLLEESQSQTEELSAQQEELQMQTNKLVASEEELRMQQEELLENNRELEEKSIMLEEKAEELARISRYKSEFMANMSHELRTPLNSIMLLSKLMSDNTEENLTNEQIEFARIIHNSGNNLLGLINDILDLTKIEAGKVDIHIEQISLSALCNNLEDGFRFLANEKGLKLVCEQDENLPDEIFSDGLRLEQILRNIISNAVKFTDKGSVSIHVDSLNEEDALRLGLVEEKMIRFEIKDTGIGIPKEKHELIFEAFQQADGSTRRKFGGTGLGLSISKKLAHLLGGNIFLQSTPGKGSTFALIIPQNSSCFVPPVSDDQSLELRTKDEEPKHLMSNNYTETLASVKILLIVEDNEHHAMALTQFLGSDRIKCLRVGNAKDAYDLIDKQHVDCLILDMGLPDADGYKVMEVIKASNKHKNVPIIIYTGEGLSAKEEQRLKKYAHAIVLKTVNSYKRLQEEIESVFEGNHIWTDLSKNLSLIDNKLQNKTVLVVDDDVRNIFALSKLLESQQMNVLSALNGKEALHVLSENSNVDVVLMDIMMPEMDGFEAMAAIRKNPITVNLPVIALTAKAMLGDREKCINAGASDYITKPIDSEQLLSLLKIWLNKSKTD